MYYALDKWTDFYNTELLGGKWDIFFNWRPYHWYWSADMDAPVCTEQILDGIGKGVHNVVISFLDPDIVLQEIRICQVGKN